MAAAPTTVIPTLEQWCRLLRPGLANTRWDRVVAQLIGSRLAFGGLAFLLVPLSTLNVLHQKTFKEMCLDARVVLSCYSCLAGILFFMTLREPLALLLEDLVVLAQSIYETTSAETKAECDRIGRLCSFLMGLSPVYALTAMSSITVPTFFTGRLVFRFWPWFPGRTGFYSGISVTIFLGLPTVLSAFYSLTAVVTINLSCANQFKAISNRLREMQGDGLDLLPEVLDVARHHSQLVTICQRLDGVMSTLVFHLMPALIVVPAVTTFVGVAGMIDFYSFVSLPYIIIFVLFCMTGQALENGSEDLVCAAYSGAWLEQPPATRRALVTIMIKANKAQGISLRGFGRLTMTALREALTSWFSYLNLLLKFL